MDDSWLCYKCQSELEVKTDMYDAVSKTSIDYDIVGIPFEVLSCPRCGTIATRKLA